jgi:hypothetical protein
VDLPKYFSRFDALVIARDTSGVTWNSQHKSVTEWYADGLLKLRGFVLAGDESVGKGKSAYTMLSYLLTGAERKAPVIGFSYDPDRNRFWRFTQGEPANAVFVLFHGPAAEIRAEPFLKDSTLVHQEFKMAGDQRAVPGSDILQAVLFPMAQFDAAGAVLRKYRVVDQLPGRVEPANAGTILQSVDQGKWPLEIPRTIPELEARRARVTGDALTPQYTSLLPQATVLRDGIRVSAAKLQWDLVTRLDPWSLETGTTYKVSFKLGISHGGVAVNVMSPDLKEYRFQMLRRYPQKTWQESFVFTARDSAAIMTIGAYNQYPGWSKFEVRDLKVEPVVLK